MTHINRAFCMLAGATVLVMSMTGAVWAQKKGTGMVSGVVRTSDGAPIADALVSVALGADTIITRSDDDGSYSLTNLRPATYVIEARRMGFSSSTASIDVQAHQANRDFTLNASAAGIQPIRVTASWTGVTGVVGNFLLMQPVGGANVHIIGDQASVTTDEHGRFAIGLANGGNFALVVQQPGLAPKLVSFTLKPGSRTELSVLLDSARTNARDAWFLKDLDERQRLKGSRAAFVNRAELAGTQSENLFTALQYAPSLKAQGISVRNGACVYVDGQLRSAFPITAMETRDVEFVEVFPPRTDNSGTASCGASFFRTASNAGQGRPVGYDASFANAIFVWTRR